MIRPTRRARIVAAVATAGALVLGACGQPPSDAAATVNGVAIPMQDVADVVVSQQLELDEQGLPVDEQAGQLQEVQRQVLTNLIRLTVLEVAAQERGIVVTEEDVEQLWQEQVAIFGSVDDLRARLAELGLDDLEARRQLRSIRIDELLQDLVRDTIEVSDAEVQALYDAQAAQYNARAASHIAVATLEEAEEIAALLDADPDRFDELAEERSLDENTGALGGRLGQQPRGIYPQAFDDAVWENPVGAIVGPVETEFGFHLIRVDEEISRSLDDVREQLVEQLRGQVFPERYGALQDEIFAAAEIEVDGRIGAWDPETKAVVANVPLAD